MKNTKAKAKSQWTVMVYLAGDNNLAAAGSTDLREMKAVGSTPEISIVAQFDSALKNHTTARYYLRKGTPLQNDLVKQLGKTNCGDPKVLLDFVTWAVKAYPAERYILVLWNHGNGWDDENIYRTARAAGVSIARRGALVEGNGRRSVSIAQIRNVANRRHRRALFNASILAGIRERGIAYDDNAKDFLDCVELKKVLQSIKRVLGRKLDVLGMDACLMSMAEVLLQVKDSLDVTVASEQTEPSDGWPYDTVLAALAAKPHMSAEELAKVVVAKYIASYRKGDGVTQAACDLSHLQPMVGSIDVLSKAMKQSLSTSGFAGEIMQVRQQVQAYEVDDYIDLFDFCTLLGQQSTSAAVRSACHAVAGCIGSNDLVLASGSKGDSVENSHGISIYFPRSSMSNLYGRLDFAALTGWDDFLESYLAQVRRPVATAV